MEAAYHGSHLGSLGTLGSINAHYLFSYLSFAFKDARQSSKAAVYSLEQQTEDNNWLCSCLCFSEYFAYLNSY